MRRRIYEIVEVTQSKGKRNGALSTAYDILIIVTIALSIVPMLFKQQLLGFTILDWACVCVFILDYILRWITADFEHPERGRRAFLRYPATPYAVIDLMAILPTLIGPMSYAFRLFILLRLFKSFRVLKFLRYSRQFDLILRVVRREKWALLSVLWLAVGYIFISALIMFSVEPDTFDTFFDAMYWATTALTTVGYGDIHPVSVAGKLVSMASSIVGIAVVALPAGIITGGYLEEVNSQLKSNGKKQ